MTYNYLELDDNRTKRYQYNPEYNSTLEHDLRPNIRHSCHRHFHTDRHI